MLDKFAQSATTQIKTVIKKPQRELLGKGTEMTDERTLKSQCRKKMITQTLMISLASIAEKKRNSQLLKAFWNTYYCRSEITSVGGRLYGNYCKNRFCLVCSGNRKAEMIRKYLPILETWTEPHFVTLTIRSVRAKDLRKFMMAEMRAFKRIERKYCKRSQRGKDTKLVGIKSLECNFNPKISRYNPHLHLIVQNKEMAEVIVKEWLTRTTLKHAEIWGQNIKAIDDREHSLIEIIKYGTKIFTEPDPRDKKNKKTATRSIYTKALYNTIASMKGIRIFDRFGFNLPKGSAPKTNRILAFECEDWKHNPKVNDWENDENTKLTNYLPDAKLLNLLLRVDADKE